MNECIKDRYNGSDPDIDGPVPPSNLKIQGMMSERNASLSN